MQRANESFSRGALEEGAGLRVDRGTEEIVGSGVADIQVDCGVERKLDRLDRGRGLAVLMRGRGGQGIPAKVLNGARRVDLEDLAFVGASLRR